MGQPAGPPAVEVAPRLVCPFVAGRLHPGTSVALMMSGREVTWARLPRADDAAYGRLFRDLWAGGHTFVICEHDVVPTDAQLADILGCGHGWCSFDYDTDLYSPGPMFGLVRFGAEVMAEHPFMPDDALTLGNRRDHECEWWRVDSQVCRSLTIRGVPWHRHTPAVHHAHAGPPSGPP